MIIILYKNNSNSLAKISNWEDFYYTGIKLYINYWQYLNLVKSLSTNINLFLNVLYHMVGNFQVSITEK